ncbi:MAG: adenylyltransferase/cytidyltransferase family protein [Ignavibacteriales bacterium]|nr:adenylyltransferase/cytidyltransferase family protein [Ignavibacteriales bacterium]
MKGTQLQRIGVLGGTFNPIHSGHLHLAQQIGRLFSLSRIYFAVSTTPPHKQSPDILHLYHRYSMICLATEGIKGFLPSLIEIEAPASPYSIHTMEKFSAIHGVRAKELFFIAGTGYPG